MAERSQFWDTGTTGDGATTITQAQTTEWFRDVTTPRSGATSGPNTTQGIYRGVMNELAVTGIASPVSVAAGAATASGFYYKSDAAVNVAIPTPAANTRIDLIVLRASYGTTREVRITRIAGTEGAGVPSLTQTAGVTWDIPLAQVSITTGGVITVTDQRAFAQFATNHVRRDGDTMTGALAVNPLHIENLLAPANARVFSLILSNAGELLCGTADDVRTYVSSVLRVLRSGTTITDVNFSPGGDILKSGGNPVLHTANMALRVVTAWLADGAVTAAKVAANAIANANIIDEAVTFQKLASPAVTEAKLFDNAVTAAKINGLSVTTAKIADLAVTAAKLASNAVETAKIVDAAVTLAKWAHPPRRQGGNATNWGTQGTTNYTPTSMRIQTGVARSSASSQVIVTFPVAFGGTPVLVPSSPNAWSVAATAGASSFTLDVFDGSTRIATDIHWIALGPA